MIDDSEYCEGHGVRIPIGWVMPDLEKPIFLGEKRLPSITRNFVPEIDGFQGRFTIGYVLERAKDLERRSKDLLERCKYR